MYYDTIDEVKNSIDLLKKEYYELYKFKEEFYNEIYGLVNNISIVTDNKNITNHKIVENNKVITNDENYHVDSNNKTKKKWSFTENERILIIMCAVAVLCILISLIHETIENYNLNKVQSYVESLDCQSSYEKDGTYIMPDIDSRYLTISELDSYSDSNLGYMRNEIFARHGYVFANEKYKEYFENKSCYIPDFSFNGEIEGLNAYERENIKAIESLEKSRKSDVDYLYKDYENVDTNNVSEYYLVYTEAYNDMNNAQDYSQYLDRETTNNQIIEEDNLHKVRVGSA